MELSETMMYCALGGILVVVTVAVVLYVKKQS